MKLFSFNILFYELKIKYTIKNSYTLYNCTFPIRMMNLQFISMKAFLLGKFQASVILWSSTCTSACLTFSWNQITFCGKIFPVLM